MINPKVSGKTLIYKKAVLLNKVCALETPDTSLFWSLNKNLKVYNIGSFNNIPRSWYMLLRLELLPFKYINC